MAKLSESAKKFGRYMQEAGFRLDQGSNDPPVPAEVRPYPYLDQWRILTERGWYAYRLEDHSLILFNEEVGPSFSYYPCPLDVKPRHIFARDRGVVGADMYSSEFTEEYEMHLLTAKLKPHVVPIRYDYDLKGFNNKSHPVAHLHFGHDSEIRVGCGRKWTPIAFGLFVLRQNYPEFWRRLLDKPTASGLGRVIRNGLVLIDDIHRNPIALTEVFLD